MYNRLRIQYIYILFVSKQIFPEFWFPQNWSVAKMNVRKTRVRENVRVVSNSMMGL